MPEVILLNPHRVSRRTYHTSTQSTGKQMGESCEEGGPSPSHKIPRKEGNGFKCSEPVYIHMPKRLSTIELRLADVLQNLITD
jgi:hypothetical protein